MFANGVLAGWIIATMVWMFPAAGENLGDRADDLPGGNLRFDPYRGRFGRDPVSGVQRRDWLARIHLPFALPTLAGNIIGGTFIFALISHAQIRNDLCAKTRPRVGKRKSGATAGKNRDRGRLAEEISA